MINRANWRRDSDRIGRNKSTVDFGVQISFACMFRGDSSYGGEKWYRFSIDYSCYDGAPLKLKFKPVAATLSAKKTRKSEAVRKKYYVF